MSRGLIFCGDIHGDFSSLFYELFNQRVSNTDVIVCGDIGIGFHNTEKDLQFMKYSKKVFYLNNEDIRIYCVRGNHDDPSRFSKTKRLVDFAQIYLVKDYDVLKLDAANVLCIGGGFSIDKDYRLAYKWPWWEGESIKVRKKLITKRIPDNIDRLYVATHSAPSFCEPTTKLPNAKESVIKGCEEERKAMDEIYNSIKESVGTDIPVNWYYGHFHMSNALNADNFKFFGLDELELRENYNRL